MDAAATRVWAAAESLVKAGAPQDAPLVLEKDTDKVPVSLVQGQNVLLLKVINEVNNWQACARFLRVEAPVTNLKISVVPQ